MTPLEQKILDTYEAFKGLDYFALLGVDSHAPKAKIFQAAQRLNSDFHPSKFPKDLSPDARTKLIRVQVWISEAANTLLNSEKREQYFQIYAQGRGAASTQIIGPADATLMTSAGPEASMLLYLRDLEGEEGDVLDALAPTERDSPLGLSQTPESSMLLYLKELEEDPGEAEVHDLMPDSTVALYLDQALAEDSRQFSEDDKRFREQESRLAAQGLIQKVESRRDLREKLERTSDSVEILLSEVMSEGGKDQKQLEKPLPQEDTGSKLQHLFKTSQAINAEMKRLAEEPSPAPPQKKKSALPPALAEKEKSVRIEKLQQASANITWFLKGVMSEEEYKELQGGFDSGKHPTPVPRKDRPAKRTGGKSLPEVPAPKPAPAEEAPHLDVRKVQEEYDASKSMAMLLKDILMDDSALDEENLLDPAPKPPPRRLNSEKIQKAYTASESMALLLEDVLREPAPPRLARPAPGRQEDPGRRKPARSDLKEGGKKANEPKSFADELKIEFTHSLESFRENRNLYFLLSFLVAAVLLLYFGYEKYLDWVVQ